MKIKNQKTITLTYKQLEDILAEMFKDQFLPTTTVMVDFVTDAVRDSDGDIIRYNLKHITISGTEELTMEKLK